MRERERLNGREGERGGEREKKLLEKKRDGEGGGS